MVLPQFSLRMVLGLVAVLGFVSLIISRGLQGSAWAMGVSVALVALVFVFLIHALLFGIIFVFSQAFNRSPRSGAGVGRRAVSPEPVLHAPPNGSDLTPRFNEAP